MFRRSTVKQGAADAGGSGADNRDADEAALPAWKARGQNPALEIVRELVKDDSMSGNAIDIGGLIARRPGVKDGRPCLAGTGISVQRIASWYKKGLSAEEIAGELEGINLAQVHAALAYYHSNRDEIEGYLAQERKEHDRLADGAVKRRQVDE